MTSWQIQFGYKRMQLIPVAFSVFTAGKALNRTD